MKKLADVLVMVALAFAFIAQKAAAGDVEWGKVAVKKEKPVKMAQVAQPIQWGLGVGVTSLDFQIGDNGRNMGSEASISIVGTVQKPFGNKWVGLQTIYTPKIESWGRPWYKSDYNRGEGLKINSSLISGTALVGWKCLGAGLTFNYIPKHLVELERQQHKVILGENSWGYVVAVMPKIHRNLYFLVQYYGELENFGKSTNMKAASFTTGVGWKI